MSTVSDSASEATAPGEQLPQRDGWEVKKVKHLFTSQDGKRVPLSAEERTNRQGEYPYYGASGVIDRVDSYIFDEDLLLVAEDGANLLNRASPVAFVASGKYWVNNHAHILKPFDGLLRFWAYRLEAVDLTPFVTGSAQPKLTSEALFNISIVVPKSLDERSQICAFLDRESAQIDALIAKQERLIAVLQEKRQALISHAVAKGLNPDAPMKDSGVEWLGEVPLHWDCRALKRVCSLIKDGTHLPPARVATGIPLLSVRNIVDGKFTNLDDDSLIAESDYWNLTQSYTVREHDVLLAIVGATLGKVAIVGKMPPFHIQRSLAVLRPVAEILDFRFLAYALRSDFFQNMLWQEVAFSAQPGIYLGTLNEFRIGVPPLKEQKQIATYLDVEEARMAATVSKLKASIALLIEHRSALISGAVTGKIDVRNEVRVRGAPPYGQKTSQPSAKS